MKRTRTVAGIVASIWLTLVCSVQTAGGEIQETGYRLLFEHGEASRRAGDFPSAIASFEKALALAAAEKDAGRQRDCLLNLGVLKWNMGQMSESKARLASAQLLWRDLPGETRPSASSKLLQIHDLYARGKKALGLKRFGQSIRQFEAAISLADEAAQPEFALKCLRQLSLNYFDLDKMDRFLELNERALGIARALKHRCEEARCLNNIGLYFFKANRYSRALTLYEDALTILRETSYDEEDKADCLNNIALIYLSLGNYDKALRYIQEAMTIDLGMNDISAVALDLGNMGAILRNKGENSRSEADISKSLKYYLECLRLSSIDGQESPQVKLLNNIGLTYSSLSDYSKALGYFRSALDGATSSGRAGDSAAVSCNIGQAYLQMRNFPEAKTYFVRAIELAVSLNREEILWEAYLGLGHCFESEGESVSALSCYEKAADIIDTIRQRLSWDDQKTGFARDKWKVYDAWVDLLLKKRQAGLDRNSDRQIWMVVERAKARALSEGLSRGETSRPQPIDPELLRARKRLTRQISLTMSQLARRGLSRESRKSLLADLEREEDQYSALTNRSEAGYFAGPASPPGIISIENVQEGLLDADTAIVEFFLGKTRSAVILITDEQVAVESLPGRSQIEDSLRAYLKILATPPSQEFQGLKAGRRIYEELFSAVDGRLGPRRRNLIIVPDGVLCYLPFETLVRGGRNGEKGSFLIESFQVSYAPSASSLALLRRRQPARGAPGRILALGNPVYAPDKRSRVSRRKTYGDVLREIYQENGFDFSPLPFSGKEILQIAAAFPNDTVDSYTGLEAREEIVKTISLPNYRVIHFACHGFLDENAPQRSALVLSLDDDLEEDGFLQAREICELRLNADLVVLSACQTGRGRLENGEGILGLPRMFFYAGARSTISSLWRISDRSTSSLMRDFYRLLAAGEGKARALREAKLKMLKSRLAHPFYWAGFILHGDHRSP